MVIAVQPARSAGPRSAMVRRAAQCVAAVAAVAALAGCSPTAATAEPVAPAGPHQSPSVEHTAPSTEWLTEGATADEYRAAITEIDQPLKVEWWATGPFYTGVVSDPSGGWVKNVADPLLRGDYTGLRTEYQQMCSQLPTVDATP